MAALPCVGFIAVLLVIFRHPAPLPIKSALCVIKNASGNCNPFIVPVLHRLLPFVPVFPSHLDMPVSVRAYRLDALASASF